MASTENSYHPDAGMALWRRLMRVAASRGTPLADAEDLASQALMKAVESFDGDRGGFAAYCGTIHANLLKNYWRDRKVTVDIDDDWPELPGGPDPAEEHMHAERRAAFRALADRLLTELSPPQAALFLALGEVIEELEYGAISEAARRVGITPQQGHDLFRQIQRRARRLFTMEDLAAFDRADDVCLNRFAPLAPSRPVADAVDDVMVGRCASGDASRLDPVFIAARLTLAGFDRFLSGLPPATRARLVSLLS